MGFLKRLARDVTNATQNQNTSNRASTVGKVGAGAALGAILGSAITSRVPQQMPPQQGQPVQGQPQQAGAAWGQQQQQVAPPVQQQAAPPSGGVVENALAGLLGSAERFMENATGLIALCPKCQTPAAPNTACEKCGTHVSPQAQNRVGAAGANAAAAGPRKCENCGATILGAVCEYCSI